MKRILASLLALAFLAGTAYAQTPSSAPPYNIPILPPASITPTKTPLITNTLATAAGSPYISNTISNLAGAGVVCTLNQSASSGSPETTVEIDAYDEASQVWVQWAKNPASAAPFTNPLQIEVYPGIAVSSLPTGMIGVNLKMPRYFRVKETIADVGSTGAAATGTVGCDLLR